MDKIEWKRRWKEGIARWRAEKERKPSRLPDWNKLEDWYELHQVELPAWKPVIIRTVSGSLWVKRS